MSEQRIGEEDLKGLVQKLTALESQFSESEREALAAVFRAAGRHYSDSSPETSDSMSSNVRRTKGVARQAGYDEIFKIYEPVRRRSDAEKTQNPGTDTAQGMTEEPRNG